MIPTLLVVEDNTLNLELVRDVRIAVLLQPVRLPRSAGGEAS